MAIPTSLPISMSDVCLEIYGSSSTSSKSLSGLFTAATGAFNTTYEGSKDRLTNFRGYNHSPISFTAFNMDGDGYPTSALACSQGIDIDTFYHDGEGLTPIVNDTVYTDSGGTIEFNGGDSWYFVGFISLKINSNGVVTLGSLC